ncbi:hypothetical protein Tsubulata_000958 [Turnera subulata]|uniref:50S ribosomal protein L33, chloroplastic n=1 Tax=Turnera subulata TaxID=218843 RepID=A0A9Q0FEK4_9ROSI|nr:hypothetical protein Tsubulata_000958 [Turnera subulata]
MTTIAAIYCTAFPCKPRNASIPLTSNNRPFSYSPPKLTTFTSSSVSYLSSTFFSKGNTSRKPILLHSVVCMAARYGSSTRKRKIKSRRKFGDPEKKRKRRRKSTSSRKNKIKVVRLVSVEGTGYVYHKRKGTKASQKQKIEIRKYDPKMKRHAVFKEEK